MCEMKTPQRAEEISNIKIMQQDQVSLASNPDDICFYHVKDSVKGKVGSFSCGKSVVLAEKL